MQIHEQRLRDACFRAASATTGSASVDLIETVAAMFEDCARVYWQRIEAAGLPIDTLPTTIDYISEAFAHTEVGGDVRWFDATLDALLEVVAPSRAVGLATRKYRAVASYALAHMEI